MVRFTRWAVLTAGCLALGASGVQAQSTGSIGVGVAVPTGDLDTFVDPGFTLRLQSSVPVSPLMNTQLQGGWTRFLADDDVTDSGTVDSYHVSLGIRLGTEFFVGANGGYFFGDGDDQFAIFPEAGIRISRVELVGDIRVTGDARWWTVRAGWLF